MAETKQERRLEAAKAELEKAMAAAIDAASEGDMEAAANRALELRAEIADLTSAIERARQAEAEKAATMAAIQAERERRRALAELEKARGPMEKRWQSWQDRYLQLNASAAELFGELDALYTQERALWSQARQLGIDPVFSFVVRPEVSDVRRAQPALPWPEKSWI